jgi:Ca2+-binding RTX toxin-like protein
MARMTSREAFDARTFSLEVAAGNPAPAVLGVAGGYRYGVNLYDNVLTNGYNAGTERVVSYANDITLNASNLVTGGTVHAFLKQNLSGTTWVSSFILSAFEGSAASFATALSTVSTSDDRAFLNAALAGDDLISTSKYADYINSMAGDDTVRSGYGDDTVFGDLGADYIDGGSGIDSISGGDANDMVIGGRGNDFLYGNDGNDSLRGGDGNDLLAGGAGSDVFLFRTGDDRDTVTTFTQGQDMLQVSGMTATTVWNAVQEGTNTVVNVLGLEIVLQNTTVAQMTNADFIFA